MRKRSVLIAIATAALMVSSSTWKVDAQALRGAAMLSTQAQNFTPIEKAACGYRGRHCGPNRHWVCNYYHRACHCAPC